MFRKKGRKDSYKDIQPEDIFLDSSNLPSFNVHQFEGRLERPLGTRTFFSILIIFLLIGVAFLAQLVNLQVTKGDEFLQSSENNRLDSTILFARRGLILDRNGIVLAGNSHSGSATSTDTSGSRENYSERHYIESPGFAHILGYVSYPKKDSSGFYFQEQTKGLDGLELIYDELIAGENGSKIVETTATGDVLSESVVRRPIDGAPLTLSIDSRVQERLHEAISETVEDRGFTGGAGVIVDVTNGEVLSLTNFPEFSPQTLSDGEDKEEIARLLTDETDPFLNRATAGLYTPGSTIKPYVAVGVLDRKVIDPKKKILSTGTLEVPNPYDPENPSIFKDWKPHGWVDMRDALAVSSNIYFFHVSGGYGEQSGIGISGVKEYVEEFQIGSVTGIDLPTETEGVIPSPEWKEANFPGDPWRLGDTYNTSIGQYGFQVTPLQLVRAVAALANGGILVTPHLRGEVDVTPSGRVDVDDEVFQIVKEGMRQGVEEGSVTGLNVDYVNVAAKTGTAELGFYKDRVNAWVTGFFPYESPKYAFTVVMESGPAENVIGGVFVMRTLLDWMNIHTPEYFTTL